MIILGGAIGLLLPGNLAAMSLATGVKAQGKVAGINALAMGVGLVVGPTAGTAIYHASPVVAVLDRDPGARRPRGGRLLRRQAEGYDRRPRWRSRQSSCRGHTPATLSSRSARSGCRSAKPPARVATRHSRRPIHAACPSRSFLLVSLVPSDRGHRRRTRHRRPRRFRLDVGADRRQGADRDRARDAQRGARRTCRRTSSSAS